MPEPRHIAVGLSGGVDSAVAAALLVEEGDRVTGVTMTIWDGRPTGDGRGRHGCYGPEERQDVADAQRVARHLGIPLVVVDLAEAYSRRVLDQAAAAYRRGRTPNPCVVCNHELKFGLIQQALRQRGVETDAFATGHYARVRHDEASGRWLLLRGRDRRKDQSYFLCRLDQPQLAGARFPLGELTKEEVRAAARRLGLPVADKAESQDFTAGSYQELLGLRATPGPILDRGGRELGTHPGIAAFTVGQRRGLGLAAPAPLYVTALDPARNAVIVGQEHELGSRYLIAGDLNWIAIPGLEGPRPATARIRYRHQEAPATLTPLADGRVRVDFAAAQPAVCPGQAVVFYDDEQVLGGGTIETSEQERAQLGDGPLGVTPA